MFKVPQDFQANFRGFRPRPTPEPRPELPTLPPVNTRPKPPTTPGPRPNPGDGFRPNIPNDIQSELDRFREARRRFGRPGGIP